MGGQKKANQETNNDSVRNFHADGVPNYSLEQQSLTNFPFLTVHELTVKVLNRNGFLSYGNIFWGSAISICCRESRDCLMAKRLKKANFRFSRSRKKWRPVDFRECENTRAHVIHVFFPTRDWT